MGALQNSALLAGDLLNVGLLLYSSTWRHSTLDGLCGFPAPKPHLLLASLHEVTALETSGPHLTDTHPHSLGDQVLWPWLQNTPPTCHLSHCPYRHHPGSSLQLWLSQAWLASPSLDSLMARRSLRPLGDLFFPHFCLSAVNNHQGSVCSRTSSLLEDVQVCPQHPSACSPSPAPEAGGSAYLAVLGWRRLGTS